MAGLLYFLSGSTVKPRPEELSALGLQFDRPPVMSECIGRGPSGKPGVVLANPDQVERVGIYLDDQVWEPVPVLEGEPTLYVGWFKSAKPGPADLARKIQLPGPAVLLADGNEWQVPRIAAWDTEQAAHEIALPRKRRRHPAGYWYRGEVLDEYKELLHQGAEFWSVLTKAMDDADESGKFTYLWEPLGDFAATLLTINYTLTINDVSALGLFDGENRTSETALAAIEWNVREEWFKKKAMEMELLASVSGSSSPGPEGSCQDTSPATAT